MAGNLSYVLKRVKAGKTVRFFRDFYGQQRVKVQTVWLWYTTVGLTDLEIQVVRDALQQRRRSRSVPPSGQTPIDA